MHNKLATYPELKRWSMISQPETWDLLCHLLRQSSQRTKGGTCIDFGTGAGGCAMLLATLFSDRPVISIDTFEGLPPASPKDGDGWKRGDMKCEFHTIRQRLDMHGFGRVRLHKGLVEDWCERNFYHYLPTAAVIIDCNLFSPSLAALKWVLQSGRMLKGGVCVLDDCPYRGVNAAIEEIRETGVTIHERGRLAWLIL